MNQWIQCSNILPPFNEPVLVAWDQSAPAGWRGDVHYSAVMRCKESPLFAWDEPNPYAEADVDDEAWDWYEVDSEESCGWDDDFMPTHWMRFPLPPGVSSGDSLDLFTQDSPCASN